jgi:hypothetical protein
MASVKKEERFSSSNRGLASLQKAARICSKEVLGIKEGETILIITNPKKDVSMISQAIYDAVLERGGIPTLIYQPTKTQLDFADPPVIEALKARPNIMLSISAEKLGKDRMALKKPYKVGKKKYNHIFNFLLGTKKARSFWSPTVTLSMFKRTVPINYKRLRKRCADLKKVLDKADEVRISTALGMDLTIGLRGRKAKSDDGDFAKPGSGGNIPCGEVFVSPELGASNGVIKFDGSISSTKGVIIIKKPITCTVKNGFVKSITGGKEAKKFREAVKQGEKMAKDMGKNGTMNKNMAAEHAKNAYNLGELGIGLNENARIVGNMLEDEKVLKTCHIAIGANYDEDAKALIHFDGLIEKPTMVVKFKNGKTQEIMKKGELTLG